ncbi:MAG TPA: type VI secretion system membrane subunit TssM, partial [Pyrinomonadaceae bacterium]|nr:type VI secretion system membrane subunit TssM [Pyrinomonadaceae bacterium]
VIGLVLLTLPLALVTGYVAKRRGKKAEKKAEAEKAKAGESTGDKPAEKLAAPAGNYEDLTKGAEETIQFLKSSNLGENNKNGKDVVYSLPWYLVMGAPKSGKSSLVLGSNLHFQTLPSQRQSEQKFIRPTRSVDWRVTSDAVFLDTAGRYQTEGVDADEWAALLETIKKHRGNRPLDGLILTVDTERLLQADEREVEEKAKVLRARLDDARQRLKVRFPVYLIFTHADVIEGFRDSFSTSKQEGKTLVWGATIPLEKSDNAQTLFDGEYEILHDSVMKRRLMRLSAPFSPVQQLRIFNFPLHFGSARRKLGAFVTTLFRPNPFSESPFLRGFYFTAVPVNRPKVAPGQTMSNIPMTVGQTYFTEKFFRDVLLRDKDLVKTFQDQQRKPPIWGWLATALGAFVVLFLLGWAIVSLYNNKQMLDEASAKGEAILTIYKSDAGKNPLEKNPDETRREIDALDDLRDVLVQLDDYERNGAPLSMRMGLYSGDRIFNEKLLPIYFAAVEQRFKKPVVRRIEEDLKKFASGSASNPTQLSSQEEENLGKHYDLLKSYLMLSGEYKNKADSTTLVNTLKDYWRTESKVPAGLEQVALEQLDFYAKQVDRQGFPPITPDKNLVEATRKKLQAFPPVFRYYKRKVTEISKEIEDKVGIMSAERILASNGGDTTFIESNYNVPGAYTFEGYQSMKQAISEANQKLSEDDWVMGEQGKKEIAQATDASKLEERYLRDYADQWKTFVKGLNVKPYTRENADEALQSFSSSNSPIEILMKEVARQTNLSGEPEGQGWGAWLWSFFQKAQKTETGGNTPPEREFRPLFTFIGEKGKEDKAPIATYRTEIGKVANKYSSFSPNEIEQVAQDLAKEDDSKFKQLRDAEGKISSPLGVFNETPAGQELASFLNEPLDNLRNLLGASGSALLSKTWGDKILPRAKEIESGYPFEAGQSESDLTKLTAFLNPKNGELTKFYNDRLKTYFEEVDGQLRLKEGSKEKFSDEFVAYLNNAFRLRRALFSNESATPKFDYEFKLQPVENAMLEITIDGKKINEKTASARLTFPADSGDTGVFMNFGSTGGTTSTSGTTLPSNTSANSANANVSSSNTAPTASKPPQNNSGSSSDSKTWQGTWGLFRFFDDGSPQKQASGEYVLTYNLGGKKITATVKPSGEDLFNKEIFQKVRAPEKLLK